MNMKLLLPEWVREEMFEAYLADWGDAEISPAAADPKGRDYKTWLADTVRMRTVVPAHLVPATLLFLVDDAETKILGGIDIRHRLNDSLLAFGGHIGYGIVPSERGKGYAKAQLRLALPVAKSLGVSRALITCDDGNTPSARTIEALGGVLEDKRAENGGLVRRYWVDIPQETLETERLTLRQWTMDDADDMFAYAKSPKVGPAAGWKPHESRAESAEMLRGWLQSPEVWAVEEKASGRVIGSIGLHRDDLRSNPRARTIGYVLREESWGRGYMPEAVRRLTAFAFEALCMDVVSIQHFEFNDRSRRVIEKCGFRYEGTLRRASSIFDGSVHDELVYSMLREEYFAAKRAE